MSRISPLIRWPLPITAAGLALALSVPAPGMAATYPKASAVDGRLRYTSYHQDQVYNLQAAIGRALFIQFDEGEEMERFYTGDSEAWEVGKHGNIIAIKPTAEVPDTNLIVSTSTGRIYTFDLSLNARAPMYGIRFSYPNEQRRATETATAKRELSASLDPHAHTRKNYHYAGAGSPTVQPAEIFDNGTHTFMRFPENTTFPSVFAIGPDGGETLVNKTVRDNWLILPAVGNEWRLRSGQAVMCVRNDAFAPSARDNPGETTSPFIQRTAR
ncbi:MAG: TrbG/VirB9 family P-type conjugative transfer protein [Chromatiaceae bacterium]|nr:TrbG/VirB9 family P-type conjugative transfer protein [Chromatiaceae bacterium]